MDNECALSTHFLVGDWLLDNWSIKLLIAGVSHFLDFQ